MDLPPNGPSVSGSINQIVNSHAPPVRSAQGQGQLGPPNTPLVIRSQKGSRHGHSWPYPAPNNRQLGNIARVRDEYSTSRGGLPPGASLRRETDHDGASDNGERFLKAWDLPQHSYVGDSGSDIDYDESDTNSIENAPYCISGDMTLIQVTSYGESGIDILHRYVVEEALHDSGEQFPEPVRHPGTRAEILRDLTAWSVDTNARPMLWLRGSAGVGKSAIAQEFAGDCNKQGYLGASFFFKHGHPKRGTWDGLITTIAFQLANAVPEFFLPLQQAIESDKLVTGRSMAVQFQHLLVEPFTQISNHAFTPVVVVDGLDECADHKHEQQILSLFIQAIQAGQLPIRLLVASRPEPHLRAILEDQEAARLCRQKVLTADQSAYDEIEIYLRNKFSRIHSQFRSRGVDLGEGWPASDTVKQLVQRSSGIVAYASTVVRFLDDEYAHPANRLASVMALAPESTAPLDDLYTQVLSALSQGPGQLLILHAVLHPTRRLKLVLEDIDMALGLSRGTSRLMLRALHSVLEVPPLQTPLVEEEFVEPLHASFMDYLCDARRSEKWCIEDPSLHDALLKSVIRFLSNPSFKDRKWLRR
ncbi:hypothetical protein C8R44DRAFT_441399 [Mycena epipterygia]|nr:hypothetical protein C8R44DRAFT_441399 [Mycena epipterygia]